MQAFKTTLKNRLKDASKIAVLGIGSELRGDDAAGMLVARSLSEDSCSKERLKIFFGDTAPENLTGEIKKFRPTHLVIVDCADLGQKAGAIKLIMLEEIGGISFSTHRMPPKFLADYLKESISCDILFIGIQPKNIDFGVSLSKEVTDSVKIVSGLIKEVLEN